MDCSATTGEVGSVESRSAATAATGIAMHVSPHSREAVCLCGAAKLMKMVG
jgi:hypothetical protein